MNINFYKYHGTGNDFILIDNREGHFPFDDQDLVARLCDRHMGIGADGLILLEEDATTDFKMIYYNADGKEGSMCGNGGRCAVAFAKKLGLAGDHTKFMAVDGVHDASFIDGLIRLKMQDVSTVREKPEYIFLDTGSPHHVQVVENLENLDVVREGRRLRYGLYGEKGSNINFVELNGQDHFVVRTYERGVENETLSCGTGVTAVAVAMNYLGHTQQENIQISTPGGMLEVSFLKQGETYTDIYLKGPAKEVYKGTVSC